MLTTKNDVYVKILKWAKENPEFSFDDIQKAFPDQKGLIIKTMEKGQVFIRISSNSDKYMLDFESRFKLLEYEELNEARQSSKRAMTIAIISILLTLFSIIYSIIFISEVEVVNLGKVVKSIQMK